MSRRIPSNSEPTDFLYPFIDSGPVEADRLMADLAASATAKMAQSAKLRRDTVRLLSEHVEIVARAVAVRVRTGGHVFTMGNGGSSTDADAFADLLSSPPWGQPVPARSLVADRAVLSALANDVGYDLVFSRQIIAYAKAPDVLVGFSTSGNSANLIRAFAEAKRRDVLTVGLTGYEGGDMAGSPDVDHCLLVSSDSVHRVQEAQAAVGLELWRRLQGELGGVAI